MSKLGDLKNAMLGMSNGMSTTANTLMNFAQGLGQEMAAVMEAIGDTTTGEDVKMVNAMTLAQSAVKNAALHLDDAATKAKEWVQKV